ncbi:uncharacterized protein LOC134281373 [Saccostrea cucullata]|uniref:uncharacterized protein LOC134281373 n=1 Tax=Saccostrea cuccullata TaxID=36930 RepID=UPI002ED18442
MCVSTEHRKCDSVDTVEIAAQSLRESDKLSCLLTDVLNLEKRLTGSKARQEKNITEIEDCVNNMTENAEKEIKCIMDHLEKLRNNLEQEISEAVKTSKEKLWKNLEIVTDGISCAKSCADKVKKSMEKGSDVELLLEYYSARATQIEAFDIEKDVFRLCEKELSFKQEFSPSNANIRSGTFLSNSRFIVANHKLEGHCNIYDEDFTCIKIIDGLRQPFAVVEYGDDLFVTCCDTRSIKVFSSSDFMETRNIDLDIYVYGITHKNDAFFVACGDKIIKINKNGNILNEYKTGLRFVHLLALNSVDLVYSNKEKNTVIAMNDNGNNLWEYKSSNLKEPYGLERDSAENIFVAGTESRNIHVLPR